MVDLTEVETHAFFTEGIFLKKKMFTVSEVESMRGGFDEVWKQAQALLPTERGRVMLESHGARFTFEDQAVRHIAWCGNINAELRRFGGDQRLRKLARQLLGTQTIEQLINQAHFKMPGDHIAFPWHQDIEHRGAKDGRFQDINGRGSYVQIAIPLDDVTPDNGPVGMIPGSCHSGHLPHEILTNGTKGIPDALLATADAVYPQPKIGDVLVFGPYTVHGSTANASEQWRRVFINGFAAAGANQGSKGLVWDD